MQVKLKSIMAGPGGTFEPGSTPNLDKETAEQLVKGGFAEPIASRRRTATAEPDATRAGNSGGGDAKVAGADKGNGTGEGTGDGGNGKTGTSAAKPKAKPKAAAKAKGK